MNSPLSYIAGVLVFLLFALLIVPSLIDWNGYRDQFEAQATQMTGREVKIGGDISFSVFPAPHLKVAAVRVANVDVDDAHEAFFAKFDEVEAEVALLPLLRGAMNITSVHVLHPEFHFEAFADGSDNWRDFFVAKPFPKQGMFSLGSISLDKASFEQGVVTYSNAKSGRSWQFDNLSGEVIATSLLGPITADFNFNVANVPFAMRVAIGNFSNEKPFPLTTEVSMTGKPARFLFTGTTTGFSAGAKVEGTGSFEFGNTNTSEQEKAHAPVRVEAKIVAADGAATLTDLNVGMSGTTLKGSAKADWHERPRVNVTLDARALTLDSVTDRMRDMGSDKETPFAGLLGIPLPTWFDLAANIKVDGLLVHDVLVKDARVAVNLKDGVLALDRAEGEIGGTTKLHLTGAFAAGANQARRFEGEIGAESRDIAGLGLWLDALREDNGVKPGVVPVAPDAPAPTRGKPFAVSAKVSLAPASIVFQDVKAAFADKAEPAQASGSIAYQMSTGRALVTAKIDAGELDADALIALLPPKKFDLNTIIANYDFDVALDAKALTLHDAHVKDLALSIGLIKNVLSIRSFEIGDVEGSKISIAGMLSGVEVGKLDSLQGNVAGSLTSADVNPLLLALFGPSRYDAGGAAEISFSASSGEADDSQLRQDVFTAQGMVGGSRVDAVVKRRHAADGSTSNLEVVANGVNNDGRVLLRQLGLYPHENVSGVASFALQMTGDADQPYDTNLRLNANGGTLIAKGTVSHLFGADAQRSDRSGVRSFTGHIDVSAPALAPALAAVGLRDNVASFFSDQASGAGFVFSSDVTWSADALAFKAAEAVAGDLHAMGEASYTAPDDALPMLTAQLNLNTLNLTPLFAAAPKPAPAKPAKGKAAPASKDLWSNDALDWSPLAALNATIGVKADLVSVGPLKFNQVDGTLNIAKGAMNVAPMSAKIGDGQATISATFAQAENSDASVALDLRVSGADFALASPLTFGAALGGGRADVSIELEAKGRSWFALVSNANGKGNFALRRGALIPFDLVAFGKGLQDLKSLDTFSSLQEATLSKGATPVKGLGGEITLANGVAVFNQTAFVLDGGTAGLTSSYDLPRREALSDLVLTVDAIPSAPALHIIAGSKQGAITREVNTAALQSFVGTLLIDKQAKAAGVTLPVETNKAAPAKTKTKPAPKPVSKPVKSKPKPVVVPEARP